MSDIDISLRDDAKLGLISDALSSEVRRKVLRLLCEKSYSVFELSRATGVSMSTMSFHLKMLRDAGLIKMLPAPNNRGNEKNVSQNCERILLTFDAGKKGEKNLFTFDIPLGSYFSFDVTPPCSLMSSRGKIDELDQTAAFYSPKRFEARLVAFSQGHLEYRVPLSRLRGKKVVSLSLSLELCSECPNYNNDWKSDISFRFNGVKVATYRSPGDFGDRRGLLNPSWYPSQSSQYGFLKKIRVDEAGTFIEEKQASEVTIADLHADERDYLSVEIGIDDDARYVGGINIFGRGFGDHDQDIVLVIATE